MMGFAFGCAAGETPPSSTDTGSAAKPPEPAPTQTTPQAKPAFEAKEGDKVAVLETNQGRIVFKFFPEKAPKTVENFQTLTGKKFYDGTKFHRVIPGFMIQGGDPNTKEADRSKYGTGGPGHTIPGEMNDLSHVRGMVSMARTADPNSAGSQFFIVVKDSPFLDKGEGPGREGYAIFGYVLSGMDVADKIVNLPRDGRDCPNPGNEAVVKSVTIQTWPLK